MSEYHFACSIHAQSYCRVNYLVLSPTKAAGSGACRFLCEGAAQTRHHRSRSDAGTR